MIETIPKRGYRLIAPVTPVTLPAPPASTLPLPGEGSDSPRKSQGPWPARRLATAVAIMTIVAGGLWLVAGRWFAAERSLDGRQERPLAVVPFINLKPDAETDFLSFSLADAIIGRLTLIRTMDVRAAYTVHKYLTQTPTPRQAAEDLHVSLILTGSYLKEGNVLRVTPQLVDVASNQTLYQESFDIEYDRLLTVQDRVAAQVLSALHISLSSHERERWESDRPRYPLAYEFFLRGRDYYEVLRKTIEGGFFCYPYLRNDPLMESVRREGEYAVLLEQARQRHDRFKRRFF